MPVCKSPNQVKDLKSKTTRLSMGILITLGGIHIGRLVALCLLFTGLRCAEALLGRLLGAIDDALVSLRYRGKGTSGIRIGSLYARHGRQFSIGYRS